jgi:hypothetical protein
VLGDSAVVVLVITSLSVLRSMYVRDRGDFQQHILCSCFLSKYRVAANDDIISSSISKSNSVTQYLYCCAYSERVSLSVFIMAHTSFDLDWPAIAAVWKPPRVFFPTNLPEFPSALRRRGNFISVDLYDVEGFTLADNSASTQTG